MYLLDQIKYLRESILDDVGGTSVVWQNIHGTDEAELAQLRWTNEELAFFLTQAEREVARRAKLIKDTSGDYDITTVASQMEYPLDPKILRVIHAEIGDKPLIDAEIEQVYSNRGWRGVLRQPDYIITDHSTRSVSLYPIPDDEYIVNLIIYRLPKQDLSWDLADSQQPEVTEMHHFPMINYAAYLAYMKDEANALDPSRAAQFKSLFDSDYPDQTWSAEMRKMRNRGRTVRYGGL